MTNISFGDMAGPQARRLQTVRLRQQMERLSREVTTGVAADPARHLGGDYRQLSEIRHELRLLDSHDVTAQEAQARSAMAQEALGRIASLAGDYTADVLTTGQQSTNSGIAVLSAGAEQGFRATVQALNARAGGQGLFGGAATDGAALANADAMLTDLRAAVAGETTYQGYLGAIDTWFDTPGGGFETLGYTGSTNPAPPLRPGSGDGITFDLRADDVLFRDVLKGFAKAALVGDGSGFNTSLKRDLVIRGAEDLLSLGDRLTASRAELGWVEERIENAITRNAATRAALNTDYNAVLGVESYQAASELEDTRTRLEALYTLTARLSSLSLVEYLR